MNWFYITLGALAAIALGLWLYQKYVVLPRRTIVIGADMLRQQDFNSRLRKVGHREVDRIIDLFNPMMDALDIKSQKIEEQEKFLNLIMDNSPMAIAVVDNKGDITYANPAFKQLPDREVWPMASKLPLGQSQVFRMNTGAAYRGSHLSYIDQGFPHHFYLIESLTAEVAEAERHAYEQVIRTLSHEVNNTVCGVNSTLEAISDIVGDEDARAVIAACENRASNLASFVSRYAQMVKLPEPMLADTDLCQWAESNRPFLENLCNIKGCRFELRKHCEAANVQIDPALMEQVLVNLVKNGTENPGATCVSVEISDQGLDVINDGEPISEEVSQRLFTPFFTTKPQGQGIGLTTVKTILRRHNAHFSLTSHAGLTHFKIQFN